MLLRFTVAGTVRSADSFRLAGTEEARYVMKLDRCSYMLVRACYSESWYVDLEQRTDFGFGCLVIMKREQVQGIWL